MTFTISFTSILPELSESYILKAHLNTIICKYGAATVDSGTTALQNGACTYRCISKQMHFKIPFAHNGYMKSLEIYENYITLFCWKKTNFLTILYLHGILPKVVESTI
jgi:hypothetical protein